MKLTGTEIFFFFTSKRYFSDNCSKSGLGTGGKPAWFKHCHSLQCSHWHYHEITRKYKDIKWALCLKTISFHFQFCTIYIPTSSSLREVEWQVIYKALSNWHIEYSNFKVSRVLYVFCLLQKTVSALLFYAVALLLSESESMPCRENENPTCWKQRVPISPQCKSRKMSAPLPRSLWRAVCLQAGSEWSSCTRSSPALQDDSL